MYFLRYDSAVISLVRGSILKWQAIVDGTGQDLGRRNCPLCQGFPLDCTGCPISYFTGHVSCFGTPYQQWVIHHKRHHHHSGINPFLPYGVECPECLRNAEKEVEFLRQLLPWVVNRIRNVDKGGIVNRKVVLV